MQYDPLDEMAVAPVTSTAASPHGAGGKHRGGELDNLSSPRCERPFAIAIRAAQSERVREWALARVSQLGLLSRLVV